MSTSIDKGTYERAGKKVTCSFFFLDA